MSTANIKLKLGDDQLEISIEVPNGLAPQRSLLPIVQSLANTVVELAAEREEQEGHSITCRAGCGACCRQLVPISETEAFHIRDLIESLPESRRAAIQARFTAARKRLEETGMLERILDCTRSGLQADRSLGIDYFHVGIPCPFLEDESCSIHPDRPVACREHLVTSPAEHCARPHALPVRGVRLPVRVWTALAAIDPVPEGSRCVRWVPLILAPEWADAHAEPSWRPGPDLLRELFEKLTSKPIPAPPLPCGGEPLDEGRAQN